MATCIGVCAHGNLSKALIEAMGMIAGVPEGNILNFLPFISLSHCIVG